MANWSNMLENEYGSNVSLIALESEIEEIKKSLLENDDGDYYKDEAFPATKESISKECTDADYEWLRPKDLVKNAKFVGKDFKESCFKVKSGKMAQSWFAASVNCLAMNPKLFERVVPKNQSFDKNYKGIFFFRFWIFGKWTLVHVDDRLPINSKRELEFMHSKDEEYFWAALLEKAFAKHHGSYEAIQNGVAREAFEDLTGFLVKEYRPPYDDQIFEYLNESYKRNSLMTCSIEPPKSKDENKTFTARKNGLSYLNSYSIVQIEAKVEANFGLKYESVKLIRLYKCWQQPGGIWKGNFSDYKSSAWKDILPSEIHRLQQDELKEDEFWINEQDFVNIFNVLTICMCKPFDFSDNLFKESLFSQLVIEIFWKETIFKGRWIAGISAGGASIKSSTFHENPQYLIEVDEIRKPSTLFISLMVEDKRSERRERELCLRVYDVQQLFDWACVHVSEHKGGNYQIEDLIQRNLFKTFLGKFFYKHKDKSHDGIAAMFKWKCKGPRMTVNVQLKPGLRYLIIPALRTEGEEGQFTLRICSPRLLKLAQENEVRTGIVSEDKEIEDEENKNIERDWEISSHFNPTFYKISHDQEEINAYQFKELLNTIKTEQLARELEEIDRLEMEKATKDQLKEDRSKFPIYGYLTLELCKSLMAMMDEKLIGKLNKEQALRAFCQLRKWKKVFDGHQHNGLMTTAALRDAMKKAKFVATRQSLEILVLRYGTSQKDENSNTVIRFIDFEHFILMCIRLQHCISVFKSLLITNRDEPNADAKVAFTKEKFIESVLYW